MMFFKAVFALYFSAIAIAAPKLYDEAGKSRGNPSPLCTRLTAIKQK
jgi:hypothetical protein